MAAAPDDPPPKASVVHFSCKVGKVLVKGALLSLRLTPDALTVSQASWALRRSPKASCHPQLYPDCYHLTLLLPSHCRPTLPHLLPLQAPSRPSFLGQGPKSKMYSLKDFSIRKHPCNQTMTMLQSVPALQMLASCLLPACTLSEA